MKKKIIKIKVKKYEKIKEKSIKEKVVPKKEIIAEKPCCGCPEMTENERELAQLKCLHEGMGKRNIHDVGTLVVIMDRLQRQIQADKAKN